MENLLQCVSKEGILEALRCFTGKTDVKLLNEIEVRKATKGVEGLTSIVIRVKVPYCLPDDGRILWKTFIVKALPQTEFQLDIVDRCRLFAKEVIFFNEILPILVKASAGKVNIPLPNCYRATYDGSSDPIYLEDLAETGYGTPNRALLKDGLDYDHCSLAMRTVGRFHALTIAAEKLLPSKNWGDAFPILSQDSVFYYPKDDELGSPLFPMAQTSVETLVNVSRLMDGMPKKVEGSGALRKALENNWETLCRLVKPDNKGFNILTHGDCWLNNLLFRYEGDVPIDVKLIDNQITRYCHPTIDILYFMYLCTRREFREKYFKSLIQEYYNSLTEVLNVLDYGPPPISFVKLTEDLEGRYKPFGIVINTLFTPNILQGDDFLPSDSNEMTLEQLKELYNTGNATALLNTFKSEPIFRAHIEAIINEYVGWAFPEMVVFEN